MPIDWTQPGSAPQATGPVPSNKTGGIDWGTIVAQQPKPTPVVSTPQTPPARLPITPGTKNKPFVVNPNHKGLTGFLSRLGAGVGNAVTNFGQPTPPSQVFKIDTTKLPPITDTVQLQAEAMRQGFGPLSPEVVNANADLINKNREAGKDYTLTKPTIQPKQGVKEMVGSQFSQGLFGKASDNTLVQVVNLKKRASLEQDPAKKAALLKEASDLEKEKAMGSAISIAFGGGLKKVGTGPGLKIPVKQKGSPYSEKVTVRNTTGETPAPSAPKPTTPVAPPESTPTNPLLAEARKYKSAEEFVRAQGETLYHGSKAKYERFDLSKTDKGGLYGNSAYMATDASRAASYGKVTEYVVPKNAKLLKESVFEARVRSITPTVPYQDITVARAKAVEQFIKEGFDGVKTKDTTAIFNPKALQTKSQLTSIWEEAQRGIVKPSLVKPIRPNKVGAVIDDLKKQPKPEQLESRVYARLKAEHPEILDGSLPVTRVNMEDDVRRAVELVSKDKQKAYNISIGADDVPEGMTRTSVNIALSEKALQDGNHTLYARLTRNRSLEQTRRGQEINAEKGSVSDNSVSRYVKEVISEKLDRLGNKYTDKLDLRNIKTSAKQRGIDRIDAEVKRVKAKIDVKGLDIKEAQSILDRLTCT